MHICWCLLPSPDSEAFVGEGEGLFPFGGLSDTIESLKEKHLGFSVISDY